MNFMGTIGSETGVIILEVVNQIYFLLQTTSVNLVARVFNAPDIVQREGHVVIPIKINPGVDV